MAVGGGASSTSHTSLTSLFTDIASAIRTKTGGSAQIVADDFPTAITNISSLRIGSTNATRTSATQISFSVDAEPAAFYMFSSSQLSSGKVIGLFWDGSTLYLQYVYTSSSSGAYNTSLISKSTYVSYSNGVLTINIPSSSSYSLNTSSYLLRYFY